VSAIPEQNSVIDAFKKLDLLVTLDPFPTETAKLADYVIAPTMMLERADTTRAYDDWYAGPFAQYTPPILDPNPGTIEDWNFLARVAAKMGLALSIGSLTVTDGQTMATTDQIIDHLSRHGQADLEELRRRPHGLTHVDAVRPAIEASSADAGRFEVMPTDVASELSAAALPDHTTEVGPHHALLTVRRRLEVMNSLGRGVSGMARTLHNPCFIHPDQMADLGAHDGDLITISTKHGQVVAVAEPDESLLPGTVTLAHCFGTGSDEQDEDVATDGVSVGRVLSLTEDAESINGMPRMTGVPVRLERMTPAPEME
jgi:anaerobic selenocysteine-containing dehydrogenase